MRIGSLMAVLAAVLAPASAYARVDLAGFGDPVPIVDVPLGAEVLAATGQADDPTVAYAGNGFLFAWFGNIRMQLGPQDSTAHPALLSGGGERGIVWFGGGVRGAWSEPGGGFQDGQVIDPTGGGGGVGAAADDGTMAVVWLDHMASAHYAIRRPGAVFGPPHVLAGVDYTSSPRLAAGPGGEIVLAWRPPGIENRLKAAVLAPGADAFGPPEEVPVPGPMVYLHGGVAVLADGSVLFTGDGTTVVRRAPDGTYGPPQPVPDTEPGAADLAVAGEAVALAQLDGERRALRVWQLQPGGGFARPVTLSRHGALLAPHLILWPSGEAVVLSEGATATRIYVGDGQGMTVHGVDTVVPGAAPGSLSAFVADGGSLYRIDRPGEPDHRPPRLTLTTASSSRGGKALIRVDKAVTLIARARQRGRRLAALHADVAPFSQTLLRFGGRCRAPVSVSVTAVDRAGDEVVRRARFTCG